MIGVDPVTVVVQSSTSPWTVAAAVGTLIGASAAAASAFFSFRSSRESSEAARSAQTALARAVKPSFRFMTKRSGDPGGLDIGGPTTLHGAVINKGPHDAISLRAAWHLTNGDIVRGSTPRLDRDNGTMGGTRWLLDLLVPNGEEERSLSKLIDHVVVEYRDAQNIATWRTTATPNWDAGGWSIADVMLDQ